MSNILPSKVAEGGFTRMLERLGRDCGPTQYVREFTFNAIEAILRSESPGVLLVDVDWDFFEDKGIYKLSFTDTGDGMSGDDMLKLIKDLSSTGAANQYENYGLGAKIAAMTRNSAGIIYQSWKNGEGAQVILRYDEDSDQYGCAQLSLGGGEFGHWAPLDPALKPDIIDKHGTKVTLIGKAIDNDTMLLPEGVKLTKESWLYRSINERFYNIDDLVTVKVRIGYDRPRSDTKHNYLLKAKGQNHVYSKNAIESGVLSVSDAKIHWYILNEKRQGHGRDYVTGNTSIIHQGEIFDRTDGRSNRAPLFGVYFGAKNVVLIVEPEGEYNQNVQRTALQRTDGRPIPWERWSDEFKANMPKRLNEYVQALMQTASEDSHSESISERLKKFAKFYKVRRYKPTPGGVFEVDDETLVLSDTGSFKNGDGAGKGGPANTGKKSGNIEDLLAVNLKPGGVKADEASPTPFPRVDWVCIAKKTRDQGEMEDRAAQYIESENLIKANKDFMGFKNVIEHFVDEYKQIPEAAEVVPGLVEEWFEQQLMESVAGVLALRNRKYWSADDIISALSEEALTSCIMQRFHLIREVNRVLRSKLGKPKLTTEEVD